MTTRTVPIPAKFARISNGQAFGGILVIPLQAERSHCIEQIDGVDNKEKTRCIAQGGVMRIGDRVIRALTSAAAVLAVLSGSFAPMLACPAGCCYRTVPTEQLSEATAAKSCRCRCCLARPTSSDGQSTTQCDSEQGSDSAPCTCDVSPAKAIASSKSDVLTDNMPASFEAIAAPTPCVRGDWAQATRQLIASRTGMSDDSPFALISRLQV
ncbi:MAG: hypothetical protein IT428_33570 [Planctomycetaceae bacterium]|nr:hypothetical protein [Planctomycetaceae bacterium]